MGDERARRVRKSTRYRALRPLCLNEIAESIELEIGGKNTAHLAPQGRADRDDRCADTERKVWRRDERAAALPSYRDTRTAVRASYPYFHRSSCPTSLPCRSSKIRRMGNSPLRPGQNQVDGNVGAWGRAQSLTLFIVQVVQSPHLQPSAIFEANIDTVHLGQFAKCGLEQRDGSGRPRSFHSNRPRWNWSTARAPAKRPRLSPSEGARRPSCWSHPYKRTPLPEWPNEGSELEWQSGARPERR